MHSESPARLSAKRFRQGVHDEALERWLSGAGKVRSYEEDRLKIYELSCGAGGVIFGVRNDCDVHLSLTMDFSRSRNIATALGLKTPIVVAPGDFALINHVVPDDTDQSWSYAYSLSWKQTDPPATAAALAGPTTSRQPAAAGPESRQMPAAQPEVLSSSQAPPSTQEDLRSLQRRLHDSLVAQPAGSSARSRPAAQPHDSRISPRTPAASSVPLSNGGSHYTLPPALAQRLAQFERSMQSTSRGTGAYR